MFSDKMREKLREIPSREKAVLSYIDNSLDFMNSFQNWLGASDYCIERFARMDLIRFVDGNRWMANPEYIYKTKPTEDDFKRYSRLRNNYVGAGGDGDLQGSLI